MAESITYDELLAELHRLNGMPDGADKGLTTVEWAEHWGVGPDRALYMIGQAKRVGVMKCLGKQPRRAVDDTLRQSPVYAIVRPATAPQPPKTCKAKKGVARSS